MDSKPIVRLVAMLVAPVTVLFGASLKFSSRVVRIES
jgi:hypothetical protein